jgi:hypothetical protein
MLYIISTFIELTAEAHHPLSPLILRDSDLCEPTDFQGGCPHGQSIGGITYPWIDCFLA